jgi:putative glutamine transport system permease protein
MISAAVWNGLPLLFDGLVLTILLALSSGLASLVFGTCLGLARSSSISAIAAVGTAYVEIFRNIPPLIILFIFYFALPKLGIIFSGFACGLIGLTLYTTAFVGEAVRAGIASVGKGQIEAARALGHGYIGLMRHIVLPQAFKVTLPPLGNIFISLIKDTALVSTIGVEDLMQQGELLESRTYLTFQVFTVVGIFYIAVIAPLSFGVARLEKRRARRHA